MAKKEKEVKKVKTQKEEVEVKPEKKEKELSQKDKRRLEIIEEKEKYEKIIDKLIDEKYEAKKKKDKAKVKELDIKIKEAKQARSEVGAADSFFGAVRAEMKLVRWPSAKEVAKYSIAVLVFVLFFAGFFYLIDTLFALIKGAI